MPVIDISNCDKSRRRSICRGGGKIRRVVHSILLAACATLALCGPAFSQSSDRLALFGVKTDRFPNITFSLETSNAQGAFLEGLKPADLVITEDNRQIIPTELLEVQPGIQLTVAFNPSPAFANRTKDQTALDMVRQNLLTWIGSQAQATAGTFSLVSEAGPQLTAAATLQDWSQAVRAYQPDLAKTKPELTSLSKALDLASDTLPDPRMKRAILFITPPLPDTILSGLSDLSSRANQLGVRVFIWVIMQGAAGDSPSIVAMQNLADRSGGKLALVDDQSSLPNFETWLLPLRKIYQVTYLSAVQANGTHHLSVEVKRAGFSPAANPEQIFSLDVQPPNPFFISPPETLERIWATAEPKKNAPLTLHPESLALQIIVEFPDGHKRPLRATRLYVNDALAAENTSEPFDRFNLALGTLTDSGQINLRVEAVDSLGMTGKSINTPLQITVPPKPSQSIFSRISRSGLLAVGAVLVSGIALTLVLLSENRLRRGRKKNKKIIEDPLTQPVSIQQDLPRKRTTQNEPTTWPQAAALPSAPARLVRLGENELPVPGSLVMLNRHEMTLGSDPQFAMVLVDDPSVSPLHARLLHEKDDSFILVDAGSVAGTWINYAPISANGAFLLHGDLIHLGRAAFRFELTTPPAEKTPEILPVVEMNEPH